MANETEMQSSTSTSDPEVLRTQLKAALLEADTLRGRITSIVAAFELERRLYVQHSAEADADGERMTNNLIKQLMQLKHEKDLLANQVEREEEQLIGKLQRQVQTVRKEKVELENQLEQEHEFVVNRLQRKLAKMRAETVPGTQLDNAARLDGRDVINPNNTLSDGGISVDQDKQVLLTDENNRNCDSEQVRELRNALECSVRAMADKEAENTDLKRKIARSKDEKFVMQQQIASLEERHADAVGEMAMLEIGLEQEDERSFNYAARQSVSPLSDDAASGLSSPVQRCLTSATSSGSIASLANTFDRNPISVTGRRHTSFGGGANPAPLLGHLPVRPRTPSSVGGSRRSARASSVGDLMTEARFNALERWRVTDYYDSDGCPVAQNSPVPTSPGALDVGGIIRPRSAMQAIAGGGRVSRTSSCASACSSVRPWTPRGGGGGAGRGGR